MARERKVKREGTGWAYGTERKLPTCRRCGMSHFNFEPCVSERSDPALLEKPHLRHLYRDTEGQNGSFTRIERRTVPEGFSERHDLTHSVRVAPGNRIYLLRSA